MAEENKSYMEQQKQLHKNAYKPRTKEDEERLSKLFLEEKHSIEQLAELFGRNIGGIESRLIKLGLIEDNGKWNLNNKNSNNKDSSYISEIKQIYSSAYKPRTKEDDELLTHLYKNKGYSIKALSEVFERNSGGIESRLKKLGLIGRKEINTISKDEINPTDKFTHTLDSELFASLKAKRLEISRRNNTPAYIICYDYTLEFMVKQKPLTKDQMLNIPGIKEVKFEKYGEEFIQTIKSLLASYDENGFNVKTKRHKDTGDYYNNRWFNMEGINKDTGDKWDNEGFDIKGLHKDTGEIYNSNGYDINGNKKDTDPYEEYLKKKEREDEIRKYLG